MSEYQLVVTDILDKVNGTYVDLQRASAPLDRHSDVSELFVADSIAALAHIVVAVIGVLDEEIDDE